MYDFMNPMCVESAFIQIIVIIIYKSSEDNLAASNNTNQHKHTTFPLL